MRRGAGIAAIKNKNLAQARYKDKGSEIAENQLAQLSKHFESFQSNLEEFARKHKNEIRQNPRFRVQFQEMCASVGVDPLASGKGFWSEMLGIGDFYYELGVQIIEVCLATSHRHGGLLSLDDLQRRVTASRGKRAAEVSLDDLMCAIRKLKVLGNGFTLIPIGNRYLVQSVPGELTMDHTTVLQKAEGSAHVSVTQLKTSLQWEEERAHRALDYLVEEGLAWVDDQSETKERLYWFPGLFAEQATS